VIGAFGGTRAVLLIAGLYPVALVSMAPIDRALSSVEQDEVHGRVGSVESHDVER
jgi:hypothetical protein